MCKEVHLALRQYQKEENDLSKSARFQAKDFQVIPETQVLEEIALSRPLFKKQNARILHCISDRRRLLEIYLESRCVIGSSPIGTFSFTQLVMTTKVPQSQKGKRYLLYLQVHCLGKLPQQASVLKAYKTGTLFQMLFTNKHLKEQPQTEYKRSFLHSHSAVSSSQVRLFPPPIVGFFFFFFFVTKIGTNNFTTPSLEKLANHLHLFFAQVPLSKVLNFSNFKLFPLISQA